MYCPNCKAENPDGSKWCGSCGKNLQRKKALFLASSIILILYSLYSLLYFLSLNRGVLNVVILFTFSGLIGMLVSGIMALISISKHKPADKILAITAILSLVLYFVALFFNRFLMLMIFPACIWIALFLVGLKRYNRI